MRLGFRNVLERNVLLLVFDIEQDGVPLVEGAAPAVLPAQANWSPVLDQACEGERFRHTIVHRTFAGTHFGALLKQLLYFRMNVKIRGVGSQPFGELMQLIQGDSSF